MRPQLWLTREPGPKLKKYLACLNSMPKIPGCPHTSGHILQCVSQHALLAIPTRNPLQQNILHINWARETAQTDDSTLALFQMAHFFFLFTSFSCTWAYIVTDQPITEQQSDWYKYSRSELLYSSSSSSSNHLLWPQCEWTPQLLWLVVTCVFSETTVSAHTLR